MADEGKAVIVLAAEDRTGPAFQSARRNMAALQSDARKTAFQQQQLAFQLNDLFVQIASGGSPLTAIIQQGSQLSGTFGGVGNAFKAVLGLITPLRAGLLGVGAGLGVFAIGAADAEKFARSLGEVQAALSGTGRGGSLDDSQVAQFIEQIAQVPGVTRDAATQTVTELARLKEIGSDLFVGLGRLAADYARVTGKEVPDAAKELGKAFADPEKGAKTLEAALGTLSSATLLTVQKLSDQGDILGAQRVLYEELTKKIGGLASQGLTPLQRATDELSNSWDRLTGAFGKSEGFDRANDNIAKFLGNVQRAIDALPKLEQSATNAFRGSTFGRFIGIPDNTGGATGSFDGGQNTGGASASFGAPTPAAPNGKQAAEDAIKRSLELGKSYQTTSAKIAELTSKQTQLREGLRLASSEYGANSEQAKRLRDSVAAVGEQIDSLRKKGQGGDREGKQVARAELNQQLKAIQSGLEEEQSSVRFNNEYLRNLYQDGEISLREFYSRQRTEIDRGVTAKVEALTNERTAIENALKTTTDQSDRVNLETRRTEIDAEIKRTGDDASRDRALSIQDEAKAYRDLEDAVRGFQAQLAAASGQEFTAETAQIETTIQRAQVLATQSGGSITSDQIQTLREQLTIRAQINESQRQFSILSSQASNAEDRLVVTARANGQGILETEDEIRAVRQKALDQLGQLIEQTKAYAANSKDPSVLQFLDDLQTRYASLQATVDPTKLRLDAAADNIGDAIADGLARAVVEGEKLSDILNGIERDILTTVTKEVITKPLADSISGFIRGAGGQGTGQNLIGQLFGLTPKSGTVTASPLKVSESGGILDSIGGFFGGLFGGGEASAGGAVASTTAAAAATTASATSTAASLGALTVAAQSAATALASIAVTGGTQALGDAASIFSSSGGGDSSFLSFFASFFHEGGVVGEAKDLRRVSFDNAPRYHTGGIAGLKADEVPSVLLKGEEVLTKTDPRHRDNISTKVFERLQSMKEGASLTSLEGFDTTSIATEKLIERLVSDKDESSVWSEVTRYHTGGIAGLAPDEVPAVLRKGEEVLTQADPRHRDNAEGGGKGVVQNFHFHEAKPSRETMNQVGARALRGLRNVERDL